MMSEGKMFVANPSREDTSQLVTAEPNSRALANRMCAVSRGLSRAGTRPDGRREATRTLRSYWCERKKTMLPRAGRMTETKAINGLSLPGRKVVEGSALE